MNLLEEGKPIRDGHYHVEQFIGAGFFAEVYRVKHHMLGRQALKIFKTPGTLDEVWQMLGEARLLTRFGHPNVIRVFDAGTHEMASGMHGFFTMEYISGGSLATYRMNYKERLVPVPVAVDILRQSCLGLSLAHASDPPLVHRDIKPQNILVEEREGPPRVCVSDFGLAKYVNPLMLKASTRGTPSYMAPECHDDALAASRAADVYSLGLTIYLLLTDRFPYTGADLDEIRPEHFKRPLYPAGQINGGVDDRLDRILARALAVAPDERYPHAMALLEDLEEYLARDPQKTVFADPLAKKEALQVVKQAFALSRSALSDSDLDAAADLLEKAMDRFPPYRDEFKHLLETWRGHGKL
jgi:serine/threonine-protein kinase